MCWGTITFTPLVMRHLVSCRQLVHPIFVNVISQEHCESMSSDLVSKAHSVLTDMSKVEGQMSLWLQVIVFVFTKFSAPITTSSFSRSLVLFVNCVWKLPLLLLSRPHRMFGEDSAHFGGSHWSTRAQCRCSETFKSIVACGNSLWARSKSHQRLSCCFDC